MLADRAKNRHACSLFPDLSLVGKFSLITTQWKNAGSPHRVTLPDTFIVGHPAPQANSSLLVIKLRI